MTGSARALWWLYLLAAVFVARCSLTSAQHGAPWYAAGLFAVSLLLGVALARESISAAERRIAAIQAERIARIRARQDEGSLGWSDLERTCCLRAWESRGTAHDPHHCTRKDQAA